MALMAEKILELNLYDAWDYGYTKEAVIHDIETNAPMVISYLLEYIYELLA